MPEDGARYRFSSAAHQHELHIAHMLACAQQRAESCWAAAEARIASGAATSCVRAHTHTPQLLLTAGAGLKVAGLSGKAV